MFEDQWSLINRRDVVGDVLKYQSFVRLMNQNFARSAVYTVYCVLTSLYGVEWSGVWWIPT